MAAVALFFGAAGFLLHVALSRDGNQPPLASAAPAPQAAKETVPAVEAQAAGQPADSEAPVAKPALEETAAAPPPPSVPEAPEAETAAAPFPGELQTFLETLVVNGIRITDTEARAIINGRKFGIGDRIGPASQLRLTGITPRQLTFQDENGVAYRFNF